MSNTATTTTTTTATNAMGREVWGERVTGSVCEVLMATESSVWVRTVWTLDEGKVTCAPRELSRKVAALVLEPLSSLTADWASL